MRIGVDVGGTNTDAVLVSEEGVLASTKQRTTADVSSGVAAAIRQVLSETGLSPSEITSVMIGTTHFTNALVERARLDKVAILRLASPSGEALPPMTGWPEPLLEQIGKNVFLLPGGYEVDGREISPFDEAAVRAAVQECRKRGITSIAISSAFAPINAGMEERAAQVVREQYPDASISLSHAIGRLGLIERENGVVLNAALSSLAKHVVSSFEHALKERGITAPLYISQNDGTLISAALAAQYPVLTIGSGPTNSMRGAAYLTGISDGIVIDVGGTTSDIGVLAGGFPRESSIAVDIGGVRTYFRMPDILSIGLGGGTRVHLDPAQQSASTVEQDDIRIGPDSVGYQITEESFLFGGSTLTTSDIAVARGETQFGNAANLPALSTSVRDAIWHRLQAMLAEGIDRVKTMRGDATVIAVGGGHFLIGNGLPGVSQIVRPAHADVANAVGAAIAQIGAQVEQVIDYDHTPREAALAAMRQAAAARIASAGGNPETIEIVDMEEVFLSYLPGRSAQVRMKAVGDLAAMGSAASKAASAQRVKVRHEN